MTEQEQTTEVDAKPDVPTRSGFIALIGAPNAGKSTLVNQLVGSKVSIVTHKVQTTRALVRGIVIHEQTQMVLVDTPGIFKPKRRLDRAMVTTAWGGAKDADLILVLIDVEQGIDEEAEAILGSLHEKKRKVILVLNKVDRIEAPKLLELAQKANEKVNFDKTFMISALKGYGCKDLLKYLADNLPEGPWYYPEDQISDMPMRMLAAEITREKLYLRLHNELPYSSTHRDGKLGRKEGRFRSYSAGDLCRARQPEEDRSRPRGPGDQIHRPGGAQGTDGNPRSEGASLPFRQGS